MGLAQQHKMDTGCGVQNIPQVLRRDTMRVIQNQQQIVVPLLQEGVERSQRFNATGTREQYSSQATLLLSRKPRERARHIAENDGFQAGFNLNVNALLLGVEFNILIQLNGYCLHAGFLCQQQAANGIQVLIKESPVYDFNTYQLGRVQNIRHRFFFASQHLYSSSYLSEVSKIYLSACAMELKYGYQKFDQNTRIDRCATI
ncbi:hypothetical protein Q9W39_000729 [Salmonella enterica]|nr:hypothetical protein [Salmonella enterica]EMB0651616.1 hypothetical protein [Salmonella enterica]